MTEPVTDAAAGSAGGHEVYMRRALELAQEAANEGEVPVGAVVVRNGEIIGTGRNRRELARNALAHAEIEALDMACRRLGGWRLIGCDLYVTLEPCPMCAGALRAARISELYFGAYNLREGAAGTVYNLLYPAVKGYGGIKRSECESLLREYFAKLRG